MSSADQPLRWSSRSRIAFWPVFTWLMLQLGALALGATGLPLWSEFPTPGESLALHEMLVVQLTGAALLFPFLFPNVTTGLLIVGSAGLFFQIASFLEARMDIVPVMLAGGYVVLWLIGLGLLRGGLRSLESQMRGVAVITLATVGGVMLAYLNREFANPTLDIQWARAAALGPIMGAVAILDVREGAGMAWVCVGLEVVVGATWAWVGVRIHRQRAGVPQNVE